MDNEKTLNEIEEDTFENDDNSEVPPSDIHAYNELRSCADLYRMYQTGSLDIKPHYQRDEVWTDPEKSRFIDSLIKGLPIPSMCMSFDPESGIWIVIDGLQRISTIIQFLDESSHWKISKLEDIDKRISGQEVSKLRDKNSRFKKTYDQFGFKMLPVTVIRCDMKKKNHAEYVFTIFHRLNTGGTKLNNQEIRNCIFSGKFNDLLQELDQYPYWRIINRMKDNKNYRFVKQEIMLRFFAFFEEHERYSGRLSKFLNDYMKKYRNTEQNILDTRKDLFYKTTDLIYNNLFENVNTPPSLSISIEEALFVGVAKNIEFLQLKNSNYINKCFEQMKSSDEFSETNLREGLSGKDKVKNRLNTAIRVFSSDAT